MHTEVHSGMVHNGQKVEATQVFINTQYTFKAYLTLKRE